MHSFFTHLKRDLAILLSFSVISLTTTAAEIAIVIDDIGYHRNDLQALALPGNISFAILPHTPFADEFSLKATAQQKELLLHMPMQAISGKALGPGALTNDMSKTEIQDTIRKALDSYPQVIGLNNHMGSLLTQKIVPMSWTMEVLRERNLFFLDSKTTKDSNAQNMANLFGVNNIERHVFLDNELAQERMQYRFSQLIQIAKVKGSAVAIAHPYPETLTFLAKTLPQLDGHGVTLVPVSKLVETKYLQIAKAHQNSK